MILDSSMGFLYKVLLPRLFFLTASGLILAFVYHMLVGNMSLVGKRSSRWINPALIIDIPQVFFDSSASFPIMLSDFRDSPNDVIIRSVYFDDRPRDGHSNTSVFLLEVDAKIVEYNLLSGCQAGKFEASSFQVCSLAC